MVINDLINQLTSMNSPSSPISRTIKVKKEIYSKEKDFAKKMARRRLMNTKPTIEKIIKCNS